MSRRNGDGRSSDGIEFGAAPPSDRTNTDGGNPDSNVAGEMGLAILEDLPNMIWRAQADAKRDYFNKAWLAFTGRSLEEQSGDGWLEGVHPEDRDGYLETYSGSIAMHRGYRAEYRLRHRDGTYRWVREYGTPLRDARSGFAGYLGSCRHLSERQKLERAAELTRELEEEKQSHRQTRERLTMLNRLYRVLVEVNHALIRVQDRGLLFQEACRIAVDSGAFRMAWIGQLDEEGQEVRLVAHHGRDPDQLRRIEETVQGSRRGCGLLWRAVRSGEHSVCSDNEHLGTEKPTGEADASCGYRSAAAFPLKLGARVIGAFCVYAPESGALAEEEVALLDEVAGDISFALEVLEREERRRRSERALEESERKFRQLFHRAIDAIFLVELVGEDLLGRFLEVNEAASDILGYTRGELLTMTTSDVTANEDLARVREIRRSLLAGASRTFELTLVAKDGRRIPVEMSSHGFAMNGKRLALSIARDLRERRQAEEALRENEARFRRLAEGPETFVFRYEMSPTRRFTYVSPTVTQVLGYIPESFLADPHLAHKLVHPDDLAAVTKLSQKPSHDRTVTFRAIHRDGRVLWLEQRNVSILDKAGALVAYEGLVRDITGARGAEEDLKASTRKLRKAMESSIQAMAVLTEMRDPYTAGHQRGVSRLAEAVAREMGLSEDEVEAIRMAGSIHDIGKIRVPAEILTKPGRLSELEFKIIQTHAEAAREILAGIEFPWPIAEIVAQHHERMDGSGYPKGLRGGEILLAARIIAVADVVEAIASHRPYRPALGIDRAMEEISRGRETLFDAAVVDACLSVLARGGSAFSEALTDRQD